MSKIPIDWYFSIQIHKVGLKKRFSFSIIYVYLCVFVYTNYICESTWGAQRKASDAPELELQAAVSNSTGMLGAKLWASGRAVCAATTELSLQLLKWPS